MSTLSLPSGTTAAPSPTPSVAPRRHFWPWGAISRSAVSAAVLVALAAVAYWGHRSHWKMPKFSELTGRSAVTPALWCEDHNVPEAECIECNTKLLAPAADYGWCQAHGVSNCPWEHADLAQTKQPPTVTPAELVRVDDALALLPRAQNNSRCQTHTKRVQFASPEAIEKAGVDIAVVQQRPLVEAIEANGEVVYDPGRTAHLSSRVPGAIWRVMKQAGDRVATGELLAIVESSTVGQAKADFMQALAARRTKQVEFDRLASITSQEIVAKRREREAKAALQEAEIKLVSAQQALVNLGLSIDAADLRDVPTEDIAARLNYLGVPADVVAELGASNGTSNLYPLRSPLAGIVTERHAVAGEVVDDRTQLFSVADTSRMWLMLDVRQEEAQFVTIGLPVRFRPSDRPTDEMTGTVAWVSTSAEEKTRTVKVRVELENADGRLRANTFGTGRIVLRDEKSALVVPNAAIQWEGCCHVVFVRDKRYFDPKAPKFFHVRKVRLGAKQDDFTEVLAGVLPGEVIASEGASVLAAQLLKGNLVAECCHAH